MKPVFIPIHNILRLDRRSLLLGAGTAGMASLLGSRTTFADAKTVVAVMPGVFIPDAVRPLIEQKAGVKIQNAPYVSPTDTLAKLLAPGGASQYDLMISVTPFVRNPIMGAKSGDEKVAAIDLTKVPNASKIMDLFKPDIVVRDGKTYMLPIIWGYDSVIYNADKIPTDDPTTQSWGVLFNDKYAGHIAWRDDAHGMILAAGLFMGIQRSCLDVVERSQKGDELSDREEKERSDHVVDVRKRGQPDGIGRSLGDVRLDPDAGRPAEAGNECDEQLAERRPPDLEPGRFHSEGLRQRRRGRGSHERLSRYCSR